METTRPSLFRGRMSMTLAMLALALCLLGVALQIREGLFDKSAVIVLGVSTYMVGVVLLLLRRQRRRGIETTCATAGLTRRAEADGANGATARRDKPAVAQRWAPPLLGRVLPGVIFVALLAQSALLFRDLPFSVWNARKGEPRHIISSLRDNLRYYLPPYEKQQHRAVVQQLQADLRSDNFHRGALLLGVNGAGALLMALTRQRSTRIVSAAFFAVFLAIHFHLSHQVIRGNPNPHIDVFVFQQESCAAILRGENPYALRFPNIYGSDAFVYGPGVRAADRVEFGYPYTPTTLLLSLPGYLITGDSRYSQAGAMVLSAVLIALAGRMRFLAVAGAVLLLTTPRIFMIVEMAWTEPFVVLGLALTIFCATRRPRALPFALGLFLATKQYLILAVPLIWLLSPPTRVRLGPLLIKSLATTLVLTLPLALWNFREFVHSAVLLQFQQPFRNDALSFPAALWWAGAPKLAVILSHLALPLAVLATVVLARWLPRTAFGFALGVACVFLLFFALNKQAFCNYYLLVIAALACALCGAGFGPHVRALRRADSRSAPVAQL